MRLLITAFDPFGGERVNAAAEAVSALPDRIGTVELTKLTVPTEFRRCAAVVAAVVDELLPDAVLCVGQAAGRTDLTPERVAGVAEGVRQAAQLPDPVGVVTKEFTRPNGLKIVQKKVPIGVIGMIFESRPNVAVDAAVLCLKAGNACILRGGKETIRSNIG